MGPGSAAQHFMLRRIRDDGLVGKRAIRSHVSIREKSAPPLGSTLGRLHQ
jgi:hypothetical protein